MVYNNPAVDDREIIFVDKPEGMTSFSVLKHIKRTLDIGKAGHAGTLDPLATGLMIIGIGTGTKKLKEYIGLDKVYEAGVLLGKRTNSGDLEGEVVEEKAVPEITENNVNTALSEMVGQLTLPAPIYSSLKRGGESLHKKARRGEDVTPHPVIMEVIESELLKIESGEETVLHIKWHVGSGTYIRSLAEEIGLKLGTVATVKSLRRTKIGSHDVREAETLDYMSSK